MRISHFIAVTAAVSSSCWLPAMAEGSTTTMRRQTLRGGESSSVMLAEQCPQGYRPVTEGVDACRTAMSLLKDTAGTTFQGTETESNWPAGCYFCAGAAGCADGTWFNKDPQGSDKVISGVKRYCAEVMVPPIPVVLAEQCPQGYLPVTEGVDACRTAMSLLKDTASSSPQDFYGYTFQGTETESNWPAGCYFCDSAAGCRDGTWFNKDQQGSDEVVSGVQRYCAQNIEQLMEQTEILFLGDSDIDYWPDTTGKYPNSVNLGVAGYTCPEVWNDIRKNDGALIDVFGPPDTAVLVCGENDLAGGSSAQETLQFTKKIIQLLTQKGVRTVFLGTKPEPDTLDLHDDYQKYDTMVQGLAVQLGRNSEASQPAPMTFIEVYDAFEALGNPDNLYASDELHLSSRGYALWDTWTQTAIADGQGLCLVWESDVCQNERTT